MKMALSFVDVLLNMNALQWDFFHTLEDKTHFMSFCITNSSLIFKWSFINRLQGKYNMWLIGKKRFENNHIWRHTTLVKISMKVQLNFNFSMTEEVKDTTNWLDVINEWSLIMFQVLAVYDRFGRLIHGNPVVAKDVLVTFSQLLCYTINVLILDVKNLDKWADFRPKIA